MMNDDIKAAFQACSASLMQFLMWQGWQFDAEANRNLPYWLADHQTYTAETIIHHGDPMQRGQWPPCVVVEHQHTC